MKNQSMGKLFAIFCLILLEHENSMAQKQILRDFFKQLYLYYIYLVTNVRMQDIVAIFRD